MDHRFELIIFFVVQQFTDGGKDIIFANYSPTWKLHRKIAGKALRYETSIDFNLSDIVLLFNEQK
jgi:hypothetical protein